MSIATETSSQVEPKTGAVRASTDLYDDLVVLAARAVCRLDGVDDRLKDELSSELESVKLVARFPSQPRVLSPVERAAAIREAAHSAPGLNYGPFDAIIANSIEQIVEEHSDLVGGDLEAVALIRSAIERGIEIANTRLGDLA